MLDTIMGDSGNRFIIAALAVAAGLALLILVLWLMRNRSSSTFIRGGKNRQPRLAVLDAAAVDTRRRLVLVRRDDVEHLIMIGGPTDIVIESRIGTPAPASLPAREEAMLVPQTVQAAQRQPPVTAARKEAVVTEPLNAEPVRQGRQEPEPRPEPDRRPEPQAERRPEAKPVSAMAQVLYSDPEGEETPRTPVLPERRAAETPVATATLIPGREAQPQPAARGTEQMAAVAAERQPVLNHPVTTASNPAQATAGVSVSPTLDAEDILDAARSRVLPRQTGPLAEAAAGNGRPAEGSASVRTEPAVAATPLSDFESILDAEISGDLQRLAPHDPRPGQHTPQTNPQAGRVDPAFGSPGSNDARKEPTLEQEMARMLGEMSVNRKN